MPPQHIFLPILLLAFFHFLLGQFPPNAQAKASLKFGTSTLARQNTEWEYLVFRRPNPNRHISKFLTIAMDRAYRAECNNSPGDCVTTMEWATQIGTGKDGQMCNLGATGKWHSFDPVQLKNDMLGLMVTFRAISTLSSCADAIVNFRREYSPFAKMLILLQSPSTNAPPFLVVNPELAQQIGRALNATKSAANWTKQNCEGEEGAERGLEIELDEGQRVAMNALELTHQTNDENGICLLAISDSLGQFQSAGPEDGQELALALSIFPRQCLLVNLIERKLAFAPRRLPQGRRRMGKGPPPASMAKSENGPGGAQQMELLSIRLEEAKHRNRTDRPSSPPSPSLPLPQDLPSSIAMSSLYPD